MIRYVFVLALVAFTACQGNPPHDSDSVQRKQQEAILAEASSQVGMPAIANFRERKLMKMILELRDQEDLVTYTYLVAEQTGALIFFCQSIGYPIPYSTQFTAPEKPMWDRGDRNGGNVVLPQADPNALFSPSSAEATWVVCSDPKTGEPRVVYVEPKVISTPFRRDVAAGTAER